MNTAEGFEILSPVSEAPILSVLVPVYNEVGTVLTLIDRVRKVPIRKEIVIVDDCSTDGTREVLKELTDGARNDGNNQLVVLLHDQNRGKGAAIRTALPHARGCCVAIHDADLENDSRDLPRLLERLARDPDLAAVYGSRWLGDASRGPAASRLAARILSVLVRLLFGARLSDPPTAQKVFRAGVIRSLPLGADRFEFCAEVTAEALRRGHRIAEIPVAYRPRTRAEGKKIRWRHGVLQVWTLLRCRLKARSAAGHLTARRPS